MCEAKFYFQAFDNTILDCEHETMDSQIHKKIAVATKIFDTFQDN